MCYTMTNVLSAVHPRTVLSNCVNVCISMMHLSMSIEMCHTNVVSLFIHDNHGPQVYSIHLKLKKKECFPQILNG